VRLEDCWPRQIRYFLFHRKATEDGLTWGALATARSLSRFEIFWVVCLALGGRWRGDHKGKECLRALFLPQHFR